MKNLQGVAAQAATNERQTSGLMTLMTRGRWIEVARIVVTGIVALLYWQGLVPVEVLWIAIAIGLYPLVKTGAQDLIHERKVGTEIFVTVATLVAVFGGETVAMLWHPAVDRQVGVLERPAVRGRDRDRP